MDMTLKAAWPTRLTRRIVLLCTICVREHTLFASMKLHMFHLLQKKNTKQNNKTVEQWASETVT